LHDTRTLPAPFSITACAGTLLLLAACSAKPQVDASPASSRIAPIDFPTMHSLCIPAPEDSICQTRGDGVVCRDEAGDSLAFRSWMIPDGPDVDGDEVRFSFLGRFRPAPRLRVLVAELAHDATIHVLWDSRSGRFAMLALDYDSVWISESGRTLLVLPGLPDDQRAGYALAALTRMDGAPLALRCNLDRDAVRLDSMIAVRTANGAFAPRQPDHLLQDSLLVCPVDTTLLRRELPSFLRRP